MNNIKTLGIDLAKNSFSLVGMNAHGKVVLRKTLSRKKLLAYVAQLNPCFIAMEACSGAHYWAREFKLLGHQVAIIAAKFIEPFRTGGKNDNNDAEAICEAAMRPNIWHVPVKTAEQQAVMTLHRVRQGLVKERTSMINQLRGLLSEFGIIIPKGRYSLHDVIGDILEDADNKLPHLAREMTSNLWQRIKQANEQILSYDRALSKQVREDSVAKRLMTIPGVGEQVATAVTANVPDPRLFKNSRQFCAWLGLVPRQFTTGGKIRLGRITKRGDKYLRMCLVHGARAVMANLREKEDKVSCWIRELIARRGYLKAAVALAARNARLIWTLMVKQEDYKVIN
ncbi:IS110 family transposase [Pseudoalteromonas sp. BZB3]|uniref:IS110 family transposase n=2 Tax=unclassified Pseudoalteromonas TaxID=194690 RepID=UPI0032C46374